MEGMEKSYGAVIEKKESNEGSDDAFKEVFRRNAYKIVQGAINEVLEEKGFKRNTDVAGEGIVSRVLKNLFPGNQSRREDEELIDIVRKVISGEISERMSIADKKEELKAIKKVEIEKDSYGHGKALGGD